MKISKTILAFLFVLILLISCNDGTQTEGNEGDIGDRSGVDSETGSEENNTGVPDRSSDPMNMPTVEEAEWLVMLYMDADNDLEDAILFDFNEAELVGSKEDVHIVAQVDRWKDDFDGYGNWTTAKRFYIEQDNDFDSISSLEVMDLGEVNMADGDEFADFIIWAVTNFPAQKYMIVLSDHGSGWPGGYIDFDSGGYGDHDFSLADEHLDNLWLVEIDEALGKARSSTGVDKFDVVGFDACLMGMIEVFTALEPHARYAVASEELVPGIGMAYAGFLSRLVDDPSMDGAGLVEAVVSSFIYEDVIIEYVRQNNTTDEFNTLMGENYADLTLAGIDLSEISSVNTALDGLVSAMVNVDQEEISQARAYSQAFDSIFHHDADLPSPYIDLGHFALYLSQTSRDSNIISAANQLVDALDQAVVSEMHTNGRPGATGVSFYFPVRDIYEKNDNWDYSRIAERFAVTSQWDEFLEYHYEGVLEDTLGGAETSTKPIPLSPVTLSDEIATVNQPTTLETTLTGDQLAYLYLFVGRLDQEAGAMVIEDIDYMFLLDDIQDVGGVKFPVWPEGSFDFEYEWYTEIYAINDGTTSVRALISPDTFGESPTYVTVGTYVFADGRDSLFARLFFRNGELIRIYGYSAGSPYEITPQIGDQFIVSETVINLDTNEVEFQYGGTLTFGEETFWIDYFTAPSGSYLVGFIAEDFEGNKYETFQQVFVDNPDAASEEGYVSLIDEDFSFALLRPESWTVEFLDYYTDIVAENELAFARVSVYDFSDLNSAQKANEQAISDEISWYMDDPTFENLYMWDVEPFYLGAYEGLTVDFTFTYEGVDWYGSVIVATPIPDSTFSVLIMALDEDYEDALPYFNTMLQSFDILHSGVELTLAGPLIPDFASELFYDDFTDPNSGLEEWEDETGAAYYDLENYQYMVDLNPYQGPFYDYYLGGVLPDVFMIDVQAAYYGAMDNGYGMAFQVNEDAAEFYAFMISGDGYYSVWRVEIDDITVLIDWTHSSLIFTEELDINLLTVVGHSDTYDLFINEQMVDSFTDNWYSGGTFGLVVDNYDQDSETDLIFVEYLVGIPEE